MKKLLSVLLVFAIVLSFTACGGNGAKDALNKGLNAFKKFDTAGIEKYFVDGEISEEDLAVAGVEEAKAIFSTFSTEVPKISARRSFSTTLQFRHTKVY